MIINTSYSLAFKYSSMIIDDKKRIFLYKHIKIPTKKF